MFGLILSDPSVNLSLRRTCSELLRDYDLPLAAFTDESSPLQADSAPSPAFLRNCCAHMLQPGLPVPAEPVLALLQTMKERAANPLRKVLTLQHALLPELQSDSRVTEFPGGHLLGKHLLVVHVDREDRADCLLPPGKWTEIADNTMWEGRYRRLCSLNEQPVLVRENALISVNGENTNAFAEAADVITLHWFQPGENAVCSLPDGTVYYVCWKGNRCTLNKNTGRSWHLMVHRDGEELTFSSAAY